MRDGFYRIERLDDDVLSGRVQFWPGNNAAIITEIVDYAGGEKVIQGLWATGDLDEMVEHIIPFVEDWARSIGCTSVLIESRPGWERVLKSAGYERFSVTVRKGL
jgi:hypothetical protein